MKLRIITGRAGAGKSKLVLETIAAQRFERPQILLVPEHATHEAELDLCRALGDTASRDGEVLSFQSLATRVLAQTGGLAEVTLDNGGKILTMRRALQEVASYLTVFARPSQRPAFLRELVALDCYKIVSVESPVETLVEGVEQINTETEEEYSANAASLLRQNPDVVYITEITNYTAQATIQTANTGKVVFSTIHANSISDVLSRLMDITNMSSDRLLLSMHSCCYQELVRDEETDTIRPVNRCVYFSDELKMRLYGKSVGECKMILQEVESQWA